MPDIQQRIAEIVCNAHSADTDAWEITYDKGREHWLHVAEVLVSELRLTQEWTFSWEIPKGSERRYGISCETREEATAEGEPYMDIVSRYFTEWVPE